MLMALEKLELRCFALSSSKESTLNLRARAHVCVCVCEV
jgi:hypothetical protein